MSIGEILNHSEEEKAAAIGPLNNVSPIDLDIFLDESKEVDDEDDSNRQGHHGHHSHIELSNNSSLDLEGDLSVQQKCFKDDDSDLSIDFQDLFIKKK